MKNKITKKGTVLLMKDEMLDKVDFFDMKDDMFHYLNTSSEHDFEWWMNVYQPSSPIFFPTIWEEGGEVKLSSAKKFIQRTTAQGVPPTKTTRDLAIYIKVRGLKLLWE